MVIQSQTLSDYNSPITNSRIVSKRKQYSDLDLSLKLHPDFHDIMPLIDIDAVTASVKNLILSNFNDRPFNPNLGSNLRGLLFEPADRFTIVSLKEYIKRVLEIYEPRIDSIRIQIQDNSNSNRYDIVVGFRIITLAQSVDLSLYLQRIR